jgi:RNA polymerase sigma-70 factor (ECF subfamily)
MHVYKGETGYQTQRGVIVDEQAFSQLVLENQEMLFRVAYTILRHQEDCKDALQDALLKAWGSIRTLKDADAFRGWMIRIVINCSRDILRKKKIKTVELTEDISLPQAQVQDEALAAALLELDEGLRLPITLYYTEGLCMQEIAQVMRIPQGMVKNRLFRGRKKLAVLLKEYREEEKAWNRAGKECSGHIQPCPKS